MVFEFDLLRVFRIAWRLCANHPAREECLSRKGPNESLGQAKHPFVCLSPPALLISIRRSVQFTANLLTCVVG